MAPYLFNMAPYLLIRRLITNMAPYWSIRRLIYPIRCLIGVHYGALLVQYGALFVQYGALLDQYGALFLVRRLIPNMAPYWANMAPYVCSYVSTFPFAPPPPARPGQLWETQGTKTIQTESF